MRAQPVLTVVPPTRRSLAPVVAPARSPGRRAPLPTIYDLHVVLIMAPGAPRDALAMALWDEGLLVTVFDSAALAEGVLVGQHVDAVLVDHAAERRMAPQIAWWLKALGRAQTPVVALGVTDDLEAARLRREGVSQTQPMPTDAGRFAAELGLLLGAGHHPWR